MSTDTDSPDLSPSDDPEMDDADAEDVQIISRDDPEDAESEDGADAEGEDADADADTLIDPDDVEPTAGSDDDEEEPRPGVATTTSVPRATWKNTRIEYERAGENEESARTKRQIRQDARLLAAKTIRYEHEVATEPRDDNGQRGTMYMYNPETGLYEDDAEEELRSLIEEQVGQYVSKREKTEILDKVYDRAPTYSEADDEWDGGHMDETLIPAKNGVIHVEALNDPGADILLDYSEDMRMRWKLAVPFDPEMNAENTRFAEFLKTIQPDDVQRDTILGFVGAALVEDAPDGFLMMVGSGSNGKTMIQTGIERLFGGSDSPQVATEDLQDITRNRFARGQLIGARVNLAPDISGTRIEDASNLKKITGGDSMSAGRKNEQREQFESPVTLIASANSPPMMPSEKHAIQRRIYYSRFEREFVHNPDPDDPSELQARPESEVKTELYSEESLMGLLALAVEELAEVRATGEYRQGREMPPAERFSAYQSLSDTAARFAQDVLESAEGSMILKDDLYQVYQRYARSAGETPMNKSAMTRTLQNLEGLDVTSKRTRTFSPDDDRERVFEHVAFSSDVVEYMTDRIEREYVIDDDASDDVSDADGEDDGSSTRAVSEAVLDVIDELSGEETGADAGMVTTMVSAALGDGISEGDAARAVEKLKRSGDVYEPVERELRTMRSGDSSSGGGDDEDDSDDDDEDDADGEEGTEDSDETNDASDAEDVPTRSIPVSDGGDSDA